MSKTAWQIANEAFMNIPTSIQKNFNYILPLALIQAAGEFAAGDLFEGDIFIDAANYDDDNFFVRKAASLALVDLAKFVLWDGFTMP
jgi:hypothetical protein